MIKWLLFLSCLAWVPQSPDPVRIAYPGFWPDPVYDFNANPITEAKAVLGRMLFYDPVLSRDSLVSCMSCHLSYTAFAHTDHALSHGIGDSIGTRNAPALQNLAWSRRFMWDGAIHHLDFQALAPISHPAEMGETLDHVVAKLRRNPRYPTAFSRAFGKNEITGEKTLKAISAFLLTLVSSGSRYDSMRMGKVHFTQQETAGYALFQQHCSACHQEPLFTNDTFERNDWPAHPKIQDPGRFAVTRQPEDSFRFKVPSLRNLRYSYPYLHDGRISRLREVVRHYAHTDPARMSRNVPPLPDDPDRISDLLAFLNTLNDPAFVRNPAHSYPHTLFRNQNQGPK